MIANETKNIIRKYLPLIKAQDFRTIYAELENKTEGADIALFSQALREVGIDPLKYIDFIPSYYYFLYEGDILDIPENIKVIGIHSFSGSTWIGPKKLVISDSVETIERNAFQNCSGFEELYIPSSVTDISFRAFYGNNSLRKLRLDMDMSRCTYGTQIFMNCDSLEMIEMPKMSLFSIHSLFGYQASIMPSSNGEVLRYPTAAWNKFKVIPITYI